MNYDVILVRYGELSLKSSYVRKYFEEILTKNIKKALSVEDIPHTISKERGRIYLVTTEFSKSMKVLSRIFGIVSFSPAFQTTSDLEDMSALGVSLMKMVLTKEKKFAIRATRLGNHPFTSQQVAVRIGSDIVNATQVGVNLSKPDVELFIEIRNKKSFLFTEKISGVGGLPLGTQGKVLTLIDNPSSLLAAWFLMRRGCNILIANSKKTNEKHIRSFLLHWYANADIITVDLASPTFAENLSTIASQHNCDALVTGHILQEPTDALSEIMQWKKHSNIPVLTPLIAMDKTEIQKHCQTRGILL